MANRVFAIRLVQWLGWVFETQERKKEKCENECIDDEIIRPKGDDLYPYGRTRVAGEKGSGYRLPHWALYGRKVVGLIWIRFAAEALRFSVAKSSRPPLKMGKCQVKSTIISRFESFQVYAT